MKPGWFYRSTAVAVVLVGVVASTAACSSGSSGSAGSSGSQDASGGATKLTIAVSGTDEAFAQLFLAQAKGYFAAKNLDVTITNAGSDVLTRVVAGQAQLGAIGTATAILPANQGKSTTITYNNTSGAVSDFMAALPSVKSIKDCTKVVTIQVGSGTYVNAQDVKQATGASYQIVPVGNLTTLAATLTSGHADCAFGALSYFSDGIAAGKLHLLIDPRVKSTIPQGTSAASASSGCIFGLTATLSNNRDAVTRFMAAYQEARAPLLNDPPSETAATLIAKIPGFSDRKQADLAANIQADIQTGAYAPNGGVIDQAIWNTTLNYFHNGGFPDITTSNPIYSFDKRVDMSYLQG
jgi:ABC-type nitrate/sulfonate/bicarbonate transport system substrate-binding protein